RPENCASILPSVNRPIQGPACGPTLSAFAPACAQWPIKSVHNSRGQHETWRKSLGDSGSRVSVGRQCVGPDVHGCDAERVRGHGHGNNVNAWNSVDEVEVFADTGTSPTPTPTATPTPASTPRPTPTPAGGFIHPGVLVNRGQLDFVKAKIAAGTQPWKGAY